VLAVAHFTTASHGMIVTGHAIFFSTGWAVSGSTNRHSSPARVEALRSESIADLLTHFRQQPERENGKPINELSEVSAVEPISDLRDFGLSDLNRRKIPVARVATWIDQTMSESAQVMVRH
jgi:hypothetical protein